MTGVNYRNRLGWSAAELGIIDFPPMRWAVDGILPEGLSLLVGAPKVGKSWLAMDIAVAVASGRSALGQKPVEQGPVLYLALEDNGRRLQSRLDVLGCGLPPALALYTEWGTGQDAVDEVRDWLSDHADARLVIVDTLARIKGRTDRTMSATTRTPLR